MDRVRRAGWREGGGGTRPSGMVRLILALLLLAVLPARAQDWDLRAAGAMLEAIDRAPTHGLPAERYGRPALADALARADLPAAAPLADAGFRRLAADLMAGAAPASARRSWRLPAPPVMAGAVDAARARALASGDVGGVLESLAPQHPHYAALRRALASEPPAGSALRNAILASLERWRWLPREPARRHLWVNVPAFEVRLVEPDGAVRVHRAIVGKRRTPTPQFTALVSGVILNPEWIVPKSIQAEGIARMLATNPKGAAAKGYRRTGTGITQGPGPHNQLGQVKLRMPNPWAIYLHDTPARTLFARKERALSHGCIRTQDILGLAEALLAGTPGWDRKALDAAVAAGTTLDVPLAAPVPVHIVYFTAEPDGAGGIRIHADIYGRDAPILAALAAGGAPSAAQPARNQEAARAERGEDMVEFLGCKSEAAMAAADLAAGAGHRGAHIAGAMDNDGAGLGIAVAGVEADEPHRPAVLADIVAGGQVAAFR